MCVLLAAIGAGLVLVEAGARVYVAVADPPLRDYHAFMRSIPPPYRDAPFDSEAMVEEYIDDVEYHTPPGTRLVIPNDRQGEFINVTNGRRHTVGQPAASDHTVYLLGGSTVLSREVPDGETIASHLQRLLLERFGETYRVENLGVVAVNSRQQLDRLRTIETMPGDVVIFYDGVNEIYRSLYSDDPAGWTVEEHLRERAALPWHRRWKLDLYDRLYHRSRFVTHFLDPYDTTTVPAHLRDRGVLARRVSELRDRYAGTIAEAERFCRKRGVRFHHFLQPNLFTVRHRSEYEDALLASRHFTAAGVDVGFRHGYPALREAVGRLTASGVSSTDLSGALDGRPDGEEFYFDFCHVNHRANRIVAESIAAVAFAPDVAESSATAENRAAKQR